VPKTQLQELSFRVRVAECGRVIAQNILIRSPAVKKTLKHASVTLSTSAETTTWLNALGYANVKTFPPGWLSRDDFPREPVSSPYRDCMIFMSVGRLVSWKGFALGLRAFALALPRLNRAEYWVAGSGPQRHELEQLVSFLGIGDVVKWLGSCPRKTTLSYLEDCDVLVHPSMRDSASWACVEALALGKPIIGLHAGGAIHQVTPDCGYLLEGRDVVPEMAETMVTLARRRDEYASKAHAARARFCTVLCAEENIPRLAQKLAQVAIGDYS
jgi:glycosyltransferase involved in cell wall biosynthesis